MTCARYPLVALLALCLSTAFGQVSLGPRVGLAMSNVAFRVVEGPVLPGLDLSTEPHAGLLGGLIADIPVSAHVNLVPELGYLRRGFNERVPVSAQLPAGELNNVLEYVEASMSARFHIGRDKARPHFLAGVTWGHLLGVSQYYKVALGKKGSVTTHDPDDLDMARWNFGLCGGAGLTIVSGKNLLIVEGRYGHGLSGLWKELLLTDTDGNKIAKLNGYDRSFQFSVSLVFPLRG
ncbi:MAG TPA: porin family protein [Flavobacteriales bacterium]|nr:porin family protein [Flavobacteriales bacterium]